jgi:CheY-like chemotaxis protein
LVLVVEDDPALRQLVKQLISKLGYRAMIAESAEVALNLVQAQGIVPDVLIANDSRSFF